MRITTDSRPKRHNYLAGLNRDVLRSFDRANGLVNLVMGAWNSLCGTAIKDAHDAVRTTPLFRGLAKKRMNDAMEVFGKYEDKHLSNFGEKYTMYLDFLDSVDEQMKRHYNMMRLSLLQVFTRAGSRHKGEKAGMVTALLLLNLSVECFDNMMAAIRKETGQNFTEHFLPARLDAVKKYWHSACGQMLTDKEDREAERMMFNDKSVNLSAKIIANILQGEEIINRAGNDALKLNPQYYENLTDEEKEIISKYN